ncbi:hypothetical protein A3Q56_02627 [Intoshia linei]|uniref:ATP synthase subunit epsilon, mitochondrial n=1 Tax=Intoshia linei TaxID=1819745 RepID=A0A177B5R0_9BILA|nr:hypothetical protein A3Q56_02627 [Intoshia linei]
MISYIQYSKACSEVLRKVLNKEMAAKAKKNTKSTVEAIKWEDGKAMK